MLCSAVAVAYLLICLSIYLFISLSFCLSIFLSIYICLSIYLSVCLSARLSVYLSRSICLDLSVSIYLSRSICLSIYLSIHLSIYLQVWTRSYSARPPQFLNLATSKTKQFCKTSFKNGELLRSWGVLCILTSKCASRHNGVHFFNISTSKSGPTLVCFVHCDFEMCFAPQRGAIFHLSYDHMAPHPPL